MSIDFNTKNLVLCVWHAKTLDTSTPKEFETWFKNEYSATVHFLEEVYNKFYKYNDIIFAIKYEGNKTCELKQNLGFRWFEDIYFNNEENKYYTKKVLNKYPNYSNIFPYTIKDILPELQNS